ncbi:MAG: hypothetical protein FJX76_06225 [Armatimonadetes bacterium]|nr:hypothetical protein [Armatimonadota bacterium]
MPALKTAFEAVHLDGLIDEATVACYGRLEQSAGLFAMIEEYVRLPFLTDIHGLEATVEAIELDVSGRLTAICARGDRTLRIPLVDLPLAPGPDRGADWIAAYHRWHDSWE